MSSKKIKFKHKPILVGGKALEWYGIRNSGDDIDYVVHKTDYDQLCKIEGARVNVFPDHTPGVQIVNGKHSTDYFLSLYHYDYDTLKKHATKNKNVLVCSVQNLLLVKSMTAFDNIHHVNKQTQKKQRDDVILITNYLISHSE